MNRILMSLVLSLGLFTLHAPKSHASVAITFGTAPTFVLGGLIVAGGGLAVGATLVAPRCDNLGCGIAKTVAFIAGASMAVLGLLILDGEQEGQVAFTRLASEAQARQVFSSEEIATYHRELDELNAINQTITAEVVVGETTDTEAQWRAYGQFLSPATIKVAGYNAQLLLNSVTR